MQETNLRIAYPLEDIILPFLAQFQSKTAEVYPVAKIFQAENIDIILLPAIYEIPDEWEIVAVPKRAALKPVLIAIDEQVHFENFTKSLKIGVFSLLHKQLLELYFPQVQAVLVEKQEDILVLLEKKQIEGVFLRQFEAEVRNLQSYIVQKCSIDVFTPQAAEGIVYILQRKGETAYNFLTEQLHHRETAIVCEYEKAFLAAIKHLTKNENFAYATLFMDTVMLNVGIFMENEGSVFRKKVETKIGDYQDFVKNLAENVLLNK